MNTFRACVLSLVLIALPSSPASELPSWHKKMRDISKALSDTIPYLYSGGDKDTNALLEKVSKLHELTEQLDVRSDHIIPMGDFDPALVYFANSFKDDIDRAYVSLKEGYADFARQSLRNITDYCIGCHTRTKSGENFSLAQSFSDAMKSAPWIERTQFLAANRQYDAAFKEIIAQLGTPQAVNASELERAARLGLAIAIRVNRDPAQAKKLAKAVETSKNVSLSMRKEGTRWLSEIDKWKSAKPKKYNSATDLIKEAQGLIEKAQEARGHGDVNFLRASGLLHYMLRTFPESFDRPQAYYLLGLSYNGLEDLALGNLQEIYFRACILERPHSSLAEKCYQKLEESCVLGYSGSSGVHIPPNVKIRLRLLKEKAAKPKEIL